MTRYRFTIFDKILDFNDRLKDLENEISLQPCREASHICTILKKLIKINETEFTKRNFKKKGFYNLRQDLTKYYREVIPEGFRILQLQEIITDAMKKDFDQWTAIPHFDKFEIDLIESSYTRDHYLHPLCVFAIGVYILSCLEKSNVIKIDRVIRLFPCWLFCALLHDLGYVIEKYSKILDVFFTKFLMVEYNATFNFKDVMFNGNYQRHLKIFNDELFGFLDIDQDDADEKNKVETIVSHTLYAENDHGLISALSALERLDKTIEIFDRLILEYSLLTELGKKRREKYIVKFKERWENETDYYRFRTLNKRYFDSVENCDPEFRFELERIRDRFKSIKNVDFKDVILAIGLHNKLIIKLNQKKDNIKVKLLEYPIVFLLLFCDAIQDWGRLKQTQNKFELTELRFDGEKTIVAKYYVPNKCKKNEIMSKMAEFERISNYLSLQDFIFEIKFGNIRPFNFGTIT